MLTDRGHNKSEFFRSTGGNSCSSFLNHSVCEFDKITSKKLLINKCILQLSSENNINQLNDFNKDTKNRLPQDHTNNSLIQKTQLFSSSNKPFSPSITKSTNLAYNSRLPLDPSLTYALSRHSSISPKSKLVSPDLTPHIPPKPSQFSSSGSLLGNLNGVPLFFVPALSCLEKNSALTLLVDKNSNQSPDNISPSKECTVENDFVVSTTSNSECVSLSALSTDNLGIFSESKPENKFLYSKKHKKNIKKFSTLSIDNSSIKSSSQFVNSSVSNPISESKTSDIIPISASVRKHVKSNKNIKKKIMNIDSNNDLESTLDKIESTSLKSNLSIPPYSVLDTCAKKKSISNECISPVNDDDDFMIVKKKKNKVRTRQQQSCNLSAPCLENQKNGFRTRTSRPSYFSNFSAKQSYSCRITEPDTSNSQFSPLPRSVSVINNQPFSSTKPPMIPEKLLKTLDKPVNKRHTISPTNATNHVDALKQPSKEKKSFEKNSLNKSDLTFTMPKQDIKYVPKRLAAQHSQLTEFMLNIWTDFSNSLC